MSYTSFKKQSKGFTLIELLVVIAIIGILSSVVLASLSTARAKSRDARRISDLGQIQLALELYFDANSSYPFNGAGLQSWTSASAPVGGVGSTSPAYIPKVPSDPTVGANYYYCPMAAKGAATCSGTSGTVLSYVLGSNLERTDNAALTTDADVTVGTAFYGTGVTCTTTGTAQPGGTEQCYDISN